MEQKNNTPRQDECIYAKNHNTLWA